MINTPHWPFAHARQEARKRGMRVEGTFGSTVNKGDTTRAILDVLIGWDLHTEKVGRFITKINYCLDLLKTPSDSNEIV